MDQQRFFFCRVKLDGSGGGDNEISRYDYLASGPPDRRQIYCAMRDQPRQHDHTIVSQAPLTVALVDPDQTTETDDEVCERGGWRANSFMAVGGCNGLEFQ